MTRPNSAALKAGLLAALQADAPLAALVPEGVFYGRAAPGLYRFVLVALLDADDAAGVFGQRGIESALFAVKAVGLSRVTTQDTIEAAAHRIDELLELGALAVTGFSFLDCVREGRIADPVPDPVDPALTWYRVGGYYRVQAAWPDTIN